MSDLNPDGSASGSRHNVRGVDLNRNFAHRWRRSRPGGVYYSGPRPLSEPESRTAARLVARVRPQRSVWFHQSLRLVNLSSGVDPGVVRRYARLVGLPARRLPSYRGTVAGWQNDRFPGTNAFVVELGPGPLSAAAVRRHSRAVRTLALTSAPAVAVSAVAPAPIPRAARAQRPVPGRRLPAGSRPPVVSRPIPFPAERKRQMRRYARRHYGIDSHLLRRPRVVVEHYTDGPTFRSAFETFASNARDPELHELPGVCAHFVVDRDGTIYQLAPLRLMCRHTIGLNHVAVGIEHVGSSDAEVMGRPVQLRASVRLTRWLQGRYRIRTGDVIGHAESLSSSFHRERVSRLRDRTHGDFATPAMSRYRRLLSRARADEG